MCRSAEPGNADAPPGHDVRLTNGDVVLRPVREDDLPQALEWDNDPEVFYYMQSETQPLFTLEDLGGMYRGVARAAHVFVIELAGRDIGTCWLQDMNVERPAQADSFAVREGGAVYTAGRRSVDSSFWTKVDLTGLHEADLDLMAGSGPAYPGFSDGRLEFGYLTANSCGLGAGAPPCVEYQTRRRDRRLAASRSSLSTP